MQKIIILILIVFCMNSITAQNDTIFFNSKWKKLDNKDTASYFRIKEINKEEDLFLQKDFYISGEIQKIAYCTDSSFRKNKGNWVSYYKNGNELEKGLYKEGKKEGYWKEWYENGEIKSAGSYIKDKKDGLWTSWYDDNVKKQVFNYKDGIEYLINRWNKDGTFQIENGNGTFIEYHENNQVKIKGAYENELKVGDWNTFIEDSILENWESYKEGELQKGISYKEGKEYPYTIQFIMPKHKECKEISSKEKSELCTMTEIQLYTSKVDYPMLAIDNDIEGKVFISFIVNKDGEVTEVKLLKGVHKLLDDVSLNHIKKLPRFIPAYQKGLPVKVKYNIPIVFKLG